MGKELRIMLVDDDEMFVESLSDILSEEGYHVEKAFSGEEALTMAQAQKFDLVLMDIKMPGMNGVEAFKEMKKCSPGTMVMMMTGYSVDELVNEAIEEGARGILRKPLDIDVLLKMIDELHKNGGLVMIVDDDEKTYAMLNQAFESKGYDVIQVPNGHGALKRVRENPVEGGIIFISENLSALNGADIFLELKKVNSDVKVVMMVSQSQDAKVIVDKSLSNGAFGCLYKPFDPKEALDIAREICRKRRSGK